MEKPLPQPEAGTAPGPQCNALGRIAESYDILHNIPSLNAARRQGNLPIASYNSAVRTVFQGAEVALLNLTRLTDRVSCHVARSNPARASVFARWLVGLHTILRRLGTTAAELRILHACAASNEGPDASPPESMSIKSSTALQGYVEAVQRMDGVLMGSFSGQGLERVKLSLGKGTHDDALYSLLHSLRLVAHDGSKWEADLYAVPTEPGMPPYEDAVGGLLLASAVKTASLAGETFYGEFVCLHQIPELLCDEANDHVEAAIRHFRADALSQAVEQLAQARALLGAVVESQRVMVECLATTEYHFFRENLGPASGIHSLAIRQHMFRDLFSCLWNDLEAWTARGGLHAEAATRELTHQRHESAPAWLKHALLTEAFRLHQLHEEWRHEHLHMPRNCLGSGGTKSMIGVPDGLETVMRMRETANAQPSLKRLHKARDLKLGGTEEKAPLGAYHRGATSLDTFLKSLTGEITRDFFPEVQGKEFCPFRSQHPVRKP
ncbi:hypothetical protein LZ198_04320 [Myxococcus sp. K15C18031901]|uniref:hypothetical protein n=1 Tax=Myxococcus dinghuensis TaxID=2906761 RepID=UPI0020A7979B|nr:hypothetical protein [Myxococcus dinghuensis]MCP3098100.1 hypothetical protein [Myxococcus dinghuensis]